MSAFRVEFPYFGRSNAQLALDLLGIALMDYIIFYQIIGENLNVFRLINDDRNLETIFSKNCAKRELSFLIISGKAR
ncbi:hypothetical protein PN499_15830 [Kamptonema animale CS-326]|jgi:hypothetical protein|uniref:hypothetical protein n=1 Tax=Kamptonema animale TaxID=92934 RepID=UPI00232CF542|nr:hypothetical protein [Kamptonema animale]MDB9512658.1 hypothetical protein [Kamptonema animale CS-326]